MSVIPNQSPAANRLTAGGLALASLPCLMTARTGMLGVAFLWGALVAALGHVLIGEFNAALREGTEPRARVFVRCLAGILAGFAVLYLYIAVYIAQATLWGEGILWSQLLSKAALTGMLGLAAYPGLALAGFAWTLPWFCAGIVSDDERTLPIRILRLWPSCALASALPGVFFLWAWGSFLRNTPPSYGWIPFLALALPAFAYGWGSLLAGRLKRPRRSPSRVPSGPPLAAPAADVIPRRSRRMTLGLLAVCALLALACLLSGEMTGQFGFVFLWVGLSFTMGDRLIAEFNTALREGTEPRLRLFAVCLAAILIGAACALLYLIAYVAITAFKAGIALAAVPGSRRILAFIGLVNLYGVGFAGLAWMAPWMAAGLVWRGDDGRARMLRILRLWPFCALASVLTGPVFLFIAAYFARPYGSALIQGILLAALAAPPLLFAVGTFVAALNRRAAR